MLVLSDETIKQIDVARVEHEAKHLKVFTFSVVASSLDDARERLAVPGNESVRWLD